MIFWDGAFSLIISKNEDIINRFRDAFPLSRDLQEENNSKNSKQQIIKNLICPWVSIWIVLNLRCIFVGRTGHYEKNRYRLV